MGGNGVQDRQQTIKKIWDEKDMLTLVAMMSN